MWVLRTSGALALVSEAGKLAIYSGFFSSVEQTICPPPPENWPDGQVLKRGNATDTTRIRHNWPAGCQFEEPVDIFVELDVMALVSVAIARLEPHLRPQMTCLDWATEQTHSCCRACALTATAFVLNGPSLGLNVAASAFRGRRLFNLGTASALFPLNSTISPFSLAITSVFNKVFFLSSLFLTSYCMDTLATALGTSASCGRRLTRQV
ncbi:unnamed protein product [Protopolystoma xenopodis]|uniref:Uncharacterized protein n=1 Tax=Protopolystoma xenopodis TaxID=117903 RepID=A0A3S5CNJ5_9PLAT|nr:unnamed protein product [Protopolystoma xenopodis]